MSHNDKVDQDKMTEISLLCKKLADKNILERDELIKLESLVDEEISYRNTPKIFRRLA